MTEMQRLRAVVTGRVQGVGYRHWAGQKARLLGLTGSIANQPDGSVEAVLEGARTALTVWLEQSREGTALADVEGVDATFTPATGEFFNLDVR